MRYISAHGSFADPNELLELLVREDEKDKLKPGEDIDDKVEAKVQALAAHLRSTATTRTSPRPSRRSSP